jgi:hypothetical protein
MAKKTQIQKFREAARAHDADESEERFDARLKDLAKAKARSKADTERDKDKPEGAKSEH